MTGDAEQLASLFVDALQRADAQGMRACMAADARFWMNLGPTEHSVDERLALLEVERANLAEHEVEDARVTLTERGFVVQETVAGRTTAGDALRIPVCFVVSVHQGLITRVEEYTDSAAAAPLIRAVFAAQRDGRG